MWPSFPELLQGVRCPKREPLGIIRSRFIADCMPFQSILVTNSLSIEGNQSWHVHDSSTYCDHCKLMLMPNSAKYKHYSKMVPCSTASEFIKSSESVIPFISSAIVVSRVIKIT